MFVPEAEPFGRLIVSPLLIEFATVMLVALGLVPNTCQDCSYTPLHHKFQN
jgi:hypothetical protein